MEDHIVHMWTGLSKVQFMQLLNEVPQVLGNHGGSTALVAYLIKLRTGDSNDRLSSILKVSRRTFERWLKTIRCLLGVFLFLDI